MNLKILLVIQNTVHWREYRPNESSEHYAGAHERERADL